MKKAAAIAIVIVAVALGLYLWSRGAVEAPAPSAAQPHEAAPPAVNADNAPRPRPIATPSPVDAATPIAQTNARSKGKGETVVKGGWGSAPGQFGRKREPESNPEAPMAIAVGRAGDVAILDQMNGRIERFQNGKLWSTIAVGGESVQDVALGPNGRTMVLDRLGPNPAVQVYGDGGKLDNEITLVGKGVREGGGVTGVFADGDGVYVEREHGALVRVGDANGATDPDRQELPGRPTRDGKFWVSAALGDRTRGEIVLRAFDKDGRGLAWQHALTVGAPILHLAMLDSDRRGNIYVAADTGSESPEPPFRIVDEAIVVARIGPGGEERGQLVLPAYPTPEETFRPLSVDDDGAVYMMVVEAAGFSIVRFPWP